MLHNTAINNKEASIKNLLSFDLDIKYDGYGRLIFFESVRLKLLCTTVLTFIIAVVYFVILPYDNWLHSWQFQTGKFIAVIAFIYIWLEGSVVFDEMMQVVTIKSWHTKLLPAKKIYYPDIKAVVLKRHGYIDEDGHEINEGYFHLRLNNEKTHLVMVFKQKKSIENARKKLKIHTKLKLETN